ncbi:Protein TAB2 chloroplastic [Turnera subulata]|uniref:Protein TAB2 chloroplastic n=1 Tax=Turnera subulata TaxID=218843 RepID=A0A9Q0FKV1_9ROSI|nr:Protein TAB2 chloroplastic [Turnera subulata]
MKDISCRSFALFFYYFFFPNLRWYSIPCQPTDMSGGFCLTGKSTMSISSFHRASMATLSFNPTRIHHKAISSVPSLSKPTNLLLSSSLNPSKTHQRPQLLHSSTMSTRLSVSTQEEEVEMGNYKEEEEEEEEEEEVEVEVEDDPTAELSYLDPDTDPESIVEWEMDFCSRPILDARRKKLWELVVCDDSLSLQFTKYFPNNVINSVTLKDALVSITEELGVPLPKQIRFFRSQMQTIITRACRELGIKPVPSKRCLSLLLWLEERYETVYTRHPGFQKGAAPLLTLDNPFAMELPENLYGEKWAFVQLPFSAVREEISSLRTRFVFGASLDLDLLGIEVGDKALIPGLAVASSRAKPLAAWMDGLEVCAIEADTSRAALILSVGITTRYTYATYKKTPVTTAEAEAWEAAKKACGGLHFLAIQDDLDSDDCVGFWLLLDLPPPSV